MLYHWRRILLISKRMWTKERHSMLKLYTQIPETTRILRERRFLLANTSRKFSPSSRPPPPHAPPSLRVNHRGPCAYVPGDQCTWQSAPGSRITTRSPILRRVLSCTNDCALSSCVKFSQVSLDGYKSRWRSNFDDLTIFSYVYPEDRVFIAKRFLVKF